MGRSDLETPASGEIEVDGSWVIGRRAETECSPDYIQACLCWAHPTGIWSTVVCESLAVVIVLLFSEAKGSEGDASVWRRRQVRYPSSGFCCEAEVVGDDRQRRRPIAPIGVIDGVEGVVVVGTPFRFSETSVTAEEDPVHHSAGEGVPGGT